jgi:hypothetical protein
MGENHQRIHQNMDFLGLREPALAAGLLQLTDELVQAGVIDEAAVERIKDSMARHLMLCHPRSAWRSDFESSIHHHLDVMFERPAPSRRAAPDSSGRRPV